MKKENQAPKTAPATPLQNQPEFVCALLANLPVAIFVKDARNGFRYEYVNRMAEEIYDTTAAAVVGQDDFGILTAAEAEISRAADQAALQPGQPPGTMERVVQRRDGREILLRVVRLALFDPNGQPRCILGIAEDITEQRRAEREIRRLNAELEQRVAERTTQLAAANKELESFCYSASHDLRAPLRAVEGFGAALAEDFKSLLPAEGQDYIARMRGAAQHMGRLIDDLLSLSRMTRAELKRAPVNLVEVANETIQRLRSGAPGRTVEWVLPAELMVSADPTLIRAVTQNLIENAWKFTGKKAAARIEIGALIQDGETVYFVKDNGVGFNMKYVQKLFVAFQRLHSPSEYPGSGIGLATVQKIIVRHGGRVWTEAQPNEGAVFYFTLGAPDAASV